MKSSLRNIESKDNQALPLANDSKLHLKDWSGKNEFQRIPDERPLKLEISELDAESMMLLEALVKAQEDSDKASTEDHNSRGRNYDPRSNTDYKSIGDCAFAYFYDRSIGPCFGNSIEKREKFWETFNNGEIFNRTAFTNLLKISDIVKLTPGEILLFAGDFYGARSSNEVIAFGKDDDERDQRFKKLFNRLKDAKLSEIDKIKIDIEELKENVHTAIFSDQIRPSPNVEISKQKENSDSKDSGFSILSKYTFFPFTVFHTEYTATCLYNFDHFGADAIEAYKA